MAGSVNKVIIIGHLGKDPEVRYMPNGGAVANVTIATNEVWKDKQSGESQERTEWHNVAFFGRLAEIAGEYLRKGRQVYVEGSLRTRKWQDKNGQDRYTTEIIASEMKMLGSREGGGGTAAFEGREARPPQRPAEPAPSSGPAAPAPTPAPAPGPGVDNEFDDDIPF